jgi:1-acyl-sn-glycerol-3-phosphate acyltransferase
MSGAEVLPYRLIGTDKIMPRGRRLPRFPRISVVFGSPMGLDNVRYDGMDKNAKYKAFAKDVMDTVYALELPHD